HYITSLLLGFKLSTFYMIPFNFNQNDKKWKLNFLLFKDNFITNKLHFNSISISSKTKYNILLKKLRVYYWIGPIYDFIIFVLLFSIGISKLEYSYLALTSLIYFCLATINFFNEDGKYAIGSKEDTRIAFDTVRSFTLCGDDEVSDESKRILTDYHIEISKNISINTFDVNNLWDFLNNLSFYTNSLLSYINNDILSLHSSIYIFFNNLIYDYDNIKSLDYRQIEKTSISLLYYFIYLKITDTRYTPNDDILDKIYNNLNSTYHKNLYELYFNNKTDYKNYLYTPQNIPSNFSFCNGYKKLIIKILDSYKK
ncbi:hypothetical protein, partial [Clostridium gallinarum]|uniref:hypothetical protein n=1 Tax=Clostridium gallinarum TaxID=2762246 RepID=UPI001A9B9326